MKALNIKPMESKIIEANKTLNIIENKINCG